MTRVAVRPELLRWARERAGVMTVDDLADRFPRLPEWESETALPTLKQIESFARAVHVPVGYLFLATPPDEPLPIPDFRTHDGRGIRRASPNLIDMLYACQERQGWYREFSLAGRMPEIDFVASANLDQRPEEVAASMGQRLGFDLTARAACRTWEEALRLFIGQAEKLGVLVMVSGIVLSNTHRALDPQEFRGFALADSRAPLVFINGADSKSGQMFTLAHELAHIWLGTSALSDATAATLSGHRREEVWCNAVAAELLVPLAAVRATLRPDEPIDAAMQRLARQFKVSTLVILRRLFDAGSISRDAFGHVWAMERERLRALTEAAGSSGGDFYRTTLSRVGKRFARALVESTLEGQTLYRDAFRMLGVSKTETFNTIGRDVGAML
ncbi:MAG: ImmA/IrrE family metallo-endopeptidase [Mesorhizobium sp.]|uniref:ImmA/IrrE family metallo-endopeptidase n=1 Tax=Mesorhizobium sp. M7A.F.Ca.ET.027.02.1.1 TaxID=2496655 RepID=UPI000FD456CC|nr:ImmA/IrrE family metallo-endopeptidase [Mesorhizobium sp. M7A.F.Ca.ET.027.02.1.1]RVD18154.1 ImmA/IrrE family metallo-endopeptidase [Mesorhizobium sp. M7A.F.Ca.ET.027.02.1.1]RWD09694.1 MAG: ImmA/IrrE family metallo-endopeptidase [Mesorhizobium sp.]